MMYLIILQDSKCSLKLRYKILIFMNYISYFLKCKNCPNFSGNNNIISNIFNFTITIYYGINNDFITDFFSIDHRDYKLIIHLKNT